MQALTHIFAARSMVVDVRAQSCLYRSLHNTNLLPAAALSVVRLMWMSLPVLQARTVQVTGDLCRRHRRDFLQLHTCTEAERDRIEAEIGQYIKACTANIAKLESAVRGPDDVGASPAADAVNASTAAHYHGVVCANFYHWPPYL